MTFHTILFLTLHNLHIYKWYTDNFLKHRLHPSSSFIYYHILQSKTIFHFFFPFRGLATKCGSAMLKPKGVSDCVPKYLGIGAWNFQSYSYFSLGTVRRESRAALECPVCSGHRLKPSGYPEHVGAPAARKTSQL